MLATPGATVLLSINPAVAIAQANDTDQFDINEVLVEQSSNGNVRAQDVDAFHHRSDGAMLLSLNRPVTLPGVGSVDDSNILLFTPEQLGADTRGSLTIFLRGADVGLSTNGIAMTTLGAYDTNDIAGPGGDILICGIATGCSLLFDSVANGMGNEIIDAISLQSAIQ